MVGCLPIEDGNANELSFLAIWSEVLTSPKNLPKLKHRFRINPYKSLSRV